jgi:hypothetical protein
LILLVYSIFGQLDTAEPTLTGLSALKSVGFLYAWVGVSLASDCFDYLKHWWIETCSQLPSVKNGGGDA